MYKSSNATFLAVVPARQGSQRVPNKNLRPLGNRPLIQWTLDAVMKSTLKANVVLTTDSDEILSLGRELSVPLVHRRPAELASSDTPMVPVIQDALRSWESIENREVNFIILLQPTSPFRTAKHIDEAIQLFQRTDHADSLVSVRQLPHSSSPESVMTLEKSFLYTRNGEPLSKTVTERHYKPTLYQRNGPAICISTRTMVIDKDLLYGDRCLAYIMDEFSSVDIDTESDLVLAEAYASHMNQGTAL